jgi:hypothetical protein
MLMVEGMKVQAQQLPAGQAAIATILNPSNAIISTPLPKPETETGVLRCVELPSPTCTRKQNTSSATIKHIVSNKHIHLPPASRNSPPQKTKQKASLGHCCSVPSMTSRHRWTAHRNDTANHSVTITPSSPPHNSTSRITHPRTTT